MVGVPDRRIGGGFKKFGPAADTRVLKDSGYLFQGNPLGNGNTVQYLPPFDENGPYRKLAGGKLQAVRAAFDVFFSKMRNDTPKMPAPYYTRVLKPLPHRLGAFTPFYLKKNRSLIFDFQRCVAGYGMRRRGGRTIQVKNKGHTRDGKKKEHPDKKSQKSKKFPEKTRFFISHTGVI
jgi:hypothetical protein